jgi:hypothetical protein
LRQEKFTSAPQFQFQERRDLVSKRAPSNRNQRHRRGIFVETKIKTDQAPSGAAFMVADTAIFQQIPSIDLLPQKEYFSAWKP